MEQIKLEANRRLIEDGKAVLGIELGSTRIKAVLIDEQHRTIAAGNHSWENQLDQGIWTYSLEAIWDGIRDAYHKLAADAEQKYGVKIRRLSAIGISAMMHGYMVFDRAGEILVPFRTWRNTITEQAAKELTELFSYPIPQRWSIAHLYQAILNGEEHVKDIDYMTTLEGYVHWKLTGQKVLGIGDVAGMFPVDPEKRDFDDRCISLFEEKIASYQYPWKLKEILPECLTAGADAGVLSAEGAALLDDSGILEAGIPLCPPEGDAGTGMVATNSVRVRTGNVSAGTSIFAMVVLEKALKKVHPELDLVTTPAGDMVAMVHCNNCTSDLNAWIQLFGEFAELAGVHLEPDQLYGMLYRESLKADQDCGEILAYNYYSGEHITGLQEGRPLLVRKPDSRFTLANLMRAHLFTTLGALKIGMDLLLKEEDVKVDRLLGHGGLFKTKGVGQNYLAAAMGTRVEVMDMAEEGGAWGSAVLAAYRIHQEPGESLAEYLENKVFAGMTGTVCDPDPELSESFESFVRSYTAGLGIEKEAVRSLR